MQQQQKTKNHHHGFPAGRPSGPADQPAGCQCAAAEGRPHRDQGAATGQVRTQWEL